MNDKYAISDELLTAFTEGATTPEETMRVLDALKHDESLREMLFIINSIDTIEESAGAYLPMARMAAASEGNLCDVQCEKRILRDYRTYDEYLSIEADEDNTWLKESGVPLHDMGRLLEKYGMSVSRRYDCTTADLKEGLSHHVRQIAVVDAGLLDGGEPTTLHAVVVLHLLDNLLRIFDPAKNGERDVFVESFEEAWAASRHYLVSASPHTQMYEPHPLDLSDVLLDDDLLALTEAIAENTHEVWAKTRKQEGWTYGPQRNDTLKQNPDMVPYSDLSESEKEYDRKTAFDALRLAKKLGFNVSRGPKHHCPNCNGNVAPNMKYCPHCGEKLSWKDFE